MIKKFNKNVINAFTLICILVVCFACEKKYTKIANVGSESFIGTASGVIVKNNEISDAKSIIQVASGSEVVLDSKWEGYSEDVKRIIAKYDGKDVYEFVILSNDDWISEEEMKTLRKAGIVLAGTNMTKEFVTWGTGEQEWIDINTKYLKNKDDPEFLEYQKIKAMTEDEFREYAYNFYDKFVGRELFLDHTGRANHLPRPDILTYDTIFDSKVFTEIQDKYISESERERSQEHDAIIESLIIVNPNVNSPAKYINALGNGEYIVVDGYVVPTESNREYMGLRKISYRDQVETTYVVQYDAPDKIVNANDAESEIFRRNNPDCIFIDDEDVVPRVSFAKGTFTKKQPRPLWVVRDQYVRTVNYLGVVRAPMLEKTIPELSKYCNGTLLAFRGWGDPLPEWANRLDMVPLYGELKSLGKRYVDDISQFYYLIYNSLSEDERRQWTGYQYMNMVDIENSQMIWDTTNVYDTIILPNKN